MATKVADLYADLSIRGDDFDAKLQSGKSALTAMGKAADESGEKLRQSAQKSAQAYEKVRTESQKAGDAAKTAGQKASDAAERARIVQERYNTAVGKFGAESDQARAAEKRLADAHKDVERAAKTAEKAQDQFTITQRRAAQAASQATGDLRKAASAMREVDDATPDGSKIEGFFDKLGQASTRGVEVASLRGGMFGSEFLGGASAKLASLGGKAGPIGAALVGVAALGLSAGALLVQNIVAGAEKEKAQDLIQAKLGVNEETAKRIGEAAGAAYGNVFGESAAANMDSARAAIQAGLLTGEETAPEIQKMIERLDTVSQIMGTEVPEVARAAGQAIRTGLVTNGAEAMDLFTRATQAGLDTSGDLLDTVTEYGTQFRKVGLDGQDALGLISQALKGGARDTDVAADAIKEFSIRAVDGSELTSAAFANLGLDAEDMATRFAQGGTTARDAFDQVLDTIRNIEDPVKRSQAAADLFGTTAEDLGNALGSMDLSNARRELGETAGAADEAAKIIGGNAASSWEGLRRNAETSLGGIQTAMAEAFGPTAADLAAKLLENKDEITAFFADIVTAALTMAEGMAQMAVGILHTWGFFADSIGGTIAGLIEGIGSVTGLIGDMLSVIPGMEGVSDKLHSVEDGARALADGIRESGDQAHAMANVIADDVIPGMATMRDRVAEAGDAARASARGMDDLQASVIAVPDEKSVIISDNSPETIERLKALGFQVENTPTGLKVTATTDEAQATLDNFITTNSHRRVDVTMLVTPQMGRPANNDPALQPGFLGPMVQNAAGSVREAQVSNRPILWAEAGPEAYIPLSPARRPRSMDLLGEVAHRFGMNLVKMAEGGVAGFDAQSAVAKAKAHDGEPYVYGALDCSGYLSAVFNAGTGQNVRFVTGSDFESMGWKPGFDANGFSIGTDKGVGANGHMAGYLYGTNIESDGSNGIQYGRGADSPQSFPYVYHWPGATIAGDDPSTARNVADDRTPRQKNIDAVIAEGKRRNMSPKQIKAAVMTMLAESEAGGSSDNLFQQQAGPQWGGNEGLAVDMGQFYDALAKQDQNSMTEAQLAQAVQQSAFADGSNYAARSAEADQEIAASAARGAAAGGYAAGKSSSSSSSMPSSVSINGVVQVEVTNWPASLQGQERTPLYSANFKMFGAGGMHGPEVVRPGDYRVLGDSEGPESYIPHALRYRQRALALWAETGRALGVPGMAAGGFGGYTRDTRDYMKPTSLYDLAALGVGLGFTAYNAVAPYIAMAESGQWNLGEMSPVLNTGANDLPGFASKIGELLNAHMEQVTALLQAIHNRIPLEMNVEVDTGNRAAGVMLSKIGQ